MIGTPVTVIRHGQLGGDFSSLEVPGTWVDALMAWQFLECQGATSNRNTLGGNFPRAGIAHPGGATRFVELGSGSLSFLRGDKGGDAGPLCAAVCLFGDQNADQPDDGCQHIQQ